MAQTAQMANDELVLDQPRILDIALVRQFSRLQQWRSTLHVFVEWALVFAAIWVGRTFWHPLLYPVLVMFIAARQHAMLVMMHDGSHYRLFRNRGLNECVGELLLAWPFLVVTMRGYRANHFPHHRHVNTDRDPDWARKQTPAWRFPKTPLQLFVSLGTSAVGLGLFKFFMAARLVERRLAQSEPHDWKYGALRLAYQVPIIAGLVYTGHLKTFLLYWIVPFFTWLQFILHLRGIAEHFAISAKGIYGTTRTTLVGMAWELGFGLKRANYHLEHHLYPSVPFYRLPELHRTLMAMPDYATKAHVSRGYGGVLRECTELFGVDASADRRFATQPERVLSGAED
jgi:fatty acid desaturase